MISENLRLLKLHLQQLILHCTTYVWSRRHKIVMCAFAVSLIWQKDIDFNFDRHDYQTTFAAQKTSKSSFSLFSRQESAPIIWDKEYTEPAETSAARASFWSNFLGNSTEENTTAVAQKGNNLANTFTNLTFKADNPNYSEKERAAARKKIKQLKYVQRFAKTAQAEMQKFGIPAAVTLAQGLLESNVGESRLATQNNNHFGIKCFSKKCKTGHCSNFTDDSHKDFFRKYKSPWESFRAHSKLLQAKRYRDLYKLNKKDYKGWAHGLKKAGYATDKKYAAKLIQLIEDLHLAEYDKERKTNKPRF